MIVNEKTIVAGSDDIETSITVLNDTTKTLLKF